MDNNWYNLSTTRDVYDSVCDCLFGCVSHDTFAEAAVSVVYNECLDYMTDTWLRSPRMVRAATLYQYILKKPAITPSGQMACVLLGLVCNSLRFDTTGPDNSRYRMLRSKSMSPEMMEKVVNFSTPELQLSPVTWYILEDLPVCNNDIVKFLTEKVTTKHPYSQHELQFAALCGMKALTLIKCGKSIDKIVPVDCKPIRYCVLFKDDVETTPSFDDLCNEFVLANPEAADTIAVFREFLNDNDWRE